MAVDTTRASSDRRIELVEAAAPVFNDVGFHRTTLAAVAARADVTASSLYRYFDSKQALLGAVIDHGTSLVESALLEARESSPTPERQLSRALASIARLSLEQPAYGSVIQRDTRNLDGPGAVAVRARWHQTLSDLAAMMSVAQPGATAWDLELVTRAMFGAASSPSYGRHRAGPSPRNRKRVDQLLRNMVHVRNLGHYDQTPPPRLRDPSAFRSHTTNRAALVSTATRLFGERGYNNVSLEEVAEVADVTVPTIYSHFKDKAQLMMAGNIQATGLLQLSVSQALAADISDWERLTQVLAAYVEFGIQNTFVVAIVVHELHGLRGYRNKPSPQLERVKEIVQLLLICRPELDLPSAHMLVRAALGLVNEVVRTRRYLGRPSLQQDLVLLVEEVLRS